MDRQQATGLGQLGGAGLGALLGSFIPVIGPALGAGLGSAAGGLGGSFMGGGNDKLKYDIDDFKVGSKLNPGYSWGQNYTPPAAAYYDYVQSQRAMRPEQGSGSLLDGLMGKDNLADMLAESLKPKVPAGATYTTPGNPWY